MYVNIYVNKMFYRYAQVSYDEGKFHKMLCNDYWQMVASISKRLQKVDFLHLIMCKYTRVLTEYFTELRTTACMLVFYKIIFILKTLITKNHRIHLKKDFKKFWPSYIC